MYPRIEVRFTSQQRQRLQQLRDRPPTPRVGKRAVCLLPSADGASNQLIAEATGLTANTLTRIRHRWNERGLASLQDVPPFGTTAQGHLTRYLDDIKEHLKVFWLPHYSPGTESHRAALEASEGLAHGQCALRQLSSIHPAHRDRPGGLCLASRLRLIRHRINPPDPNQQEHTRCYLGLVRE